MAKLQLIVDTAFDTCQIALVRDGQIFASDKAQGGGQHDRVLAGMAKDMLDQHTLSIKELSQIVVTNGPGRFTGLRVGIAFARGLALVHQTPLLGVNTIDAIAHDLAQKYPHQTDAAVIVTVKRGESFIRFSEGDSIYIVPDNDLPTISNKTRFLGGVVTSVVADILHATGITLAQDVTEPSLDAVLACALKADGQTGPVRPYYAASYAM